MSRMRRSAQRPVKQTCSTSRNFLKMDDSPAAAPRRPGLLENILPVRDNSFITCSTLMQTVVDVEFSDPNTDTMRIFNKSNPSVMCRLAEAVVSSILNLHSMGQSLLGAPHPDSLDVQETDITEICTTTASAPRLTWCSAQRPVKSLLKRNEDIGRGNFVHLLQQDNPRALDDGIQVCFGNSRSRNRRSTSSSVNEFRDRADSNMLDDCSEEEGVWQRQ